ncbi:DUF4352 domain-containing protein [Lutispora thermophila]|uniref:DUF4352 domain-containing protein n=1 Tax=Lutispora thermophila DSM 19022 TaxID=1122184 RepID=A0A1M6B5V9_9FIRM|nr:DUF4352 domain-containing protein [Lutispora thermophila]SHI44106.1 protein of unknown function [Lutispora thermophila DSM 19022]
MDIIKYARSCMCKKVAVKYFILTVVACSIILAGSNITNAEEFMEYDKTSNIIVYMKSTKTNNLVFTINGVSESKSNKFKTASEGNKLVCINLKVTNDGVKQEQLTSKMMFKLYDDKRNIYNIVLPEGTDSINGLLSAGESKEGTVWFEVPKKINKFELCIEPPRMSQKKGMLDIETVGKSNDNKGQIAKESDSGSAINIAINNLVFDIKEVSVSRGNNLGDAGEGYCFLNINLSVKNNGSKEEQMTSHMVFKLVDANNQAYNIVLPEENGINGILKPQKEISGEISFRVKEGERKFKLEIKPWTMKELKEYVDINL